MPTIRPASITSRKTIRSVASMTTRFLFGNHDTLGGVDMVFARERVPPSAERPQPHRCGSAASDHLLDLERRGIELLGGDVLVLDGELGGLSRWDVNFRWQEAVIPDRDVDVQHIVGDSRRTRAEREEKDWPKKSHALNGPDQLSPRIGVKARAQ